MPKFYILIQKAINPLLAANVTFMLVSGVYLLLKGYWYVLWMPIAITPLSSALFPILLLPGAFFAGAVRAAGPERPRIGSVMHALSLACLIGVLSLWASIVFDSVNDLLKGSLLVPCLAWAVSATITPWTVFARKEPDNLFFASLIMTLEIGCIVCAWANSYRVYDFWDRFWFIALVMTALSGAVALYEAFFFKKPPAEEA